MLEVLILTEYKRNMIAPLNLFLLLFVSRTLIGFTVSSAVLKSGYTFDLVFSTLAALAIVCVVSIPAVKLSVSGNSLLENKFLSVLYAVYFVYSGAINISKFALFSSTELNQNAKMMFFAGFMILVCTYASSLGTEAISRFGSMVFVITLIGVLGVMIAGAGEFSTLNLFPLVQNSRDAFLSNILFSVTSTNEIVLLIGLSPKINGNIIKPFYSALALSYVAGIVLIIFAIGVLGDTTALSAYPLFEVSQLSKLNTGERLEAVFTAFWIFAVFLKISLFLSCASSCVEKTGLLNLNLVKKLSKDAKRHTVSSVVCGVAMFLISWAILYGTAFEKAENMLVYIPFVVFAFIIPLGYLLFGGKKKNENS